jgi:hypothetical protein
MTTHIGQDSASPFDARIPNEETRAVRRKLELAGGEPLSGVMDLMAYLNEDDQAADRLQA